MHVYFVCFLNSYYSNGKTYTHGIKTGTPHTVTISTSEELAGVFVSAGIFIDQLNFYVRNSAGTVYYSYGPYGGWGGAPHLILAYKASTFYGSAGDIIDNFGCRGRY